MRNGQTECGGIRYFPRFLAAVCASVLLAALTVGVLPTGGEEALYGRFVRLHVLANSDSEDDQALKLRVRDAVLDALNKRMTGVSSPEEAESVCRSAIPALERLAEQVAADAGYGYPCTVTLTEERYPARTYGAYTLPAGEYRSLRVLIGAAEGHNWWCVLFPPLCLQLAEAPAEQPSAASAELQKEKRSGKAASAEDGGEDGILLAAGFTPYEISLLTAEEGTPARRRITVKFRLAELLGALLGRR